MKWDIRGSLKSVVSGEFDPTISLFSNFCREQMGKTIMDVYGSICMFPGPN